LLKNEVVEIVIVVEAFVAVVVVVVVMVVVVVLDGVLCIYFEGKLREYLAPLNSNLLVADELTCRPLYSDTDKPVVLQTLPHF